MGYLINSEMWLSEFKVLICEYDSVEFWFKTKFQCDNYNIMIFWLVVKKVIFEMHHSLRWWLHVRTATGLLFKIHEREISYT